MNQQAQPQRSTSRRAFLRGAGTVVVGLPLLEEMMLSTAVARSVPDVPARAFNIFFGLGIPAPLQQEGYDGVLEPLKPLADKLLIVRGVDHVRCDRSGMNAHYDGATGAFTAMPPDGEAKAGGPSLDQMIRKATHREGLPAGMAPSLVAGTFFRRSRVGRYVHSYSEDGTVAAAMQESPRFLFERVFGNVGDDVTDTDSRTRQIRRSVLDSVVEQYRFYTGERSPLGASSRRRISDHLDRIREYEQRAYALKTSEKVNREVPPPSRLLHGGKADPGGEGIDITLEDLTAEWRLLADIYALAIQMDRTRFGAITFLAAGERIRLKGSYQYNGRHVFDFDDSGQRRRSGSGGCSHEWWHDFNEEKKNEQLRAHAHMKMQEVAYLLNLLANEESREGNGKTILENSCVTISTESGDGRHNDVRRELSGIFHAVSGAGGRIKTGQIMDVNSEGIDIYNSILKGYDSPLKLGPADRPVQTVESILA